MKKIDSKELQDYVVNTYKLKNVIRYNTQNIIKKESVAEHSFYVALFALKICDIYKIDEATKSKAFIKALLHDMPEIELNDITHNVKEKLNLRPFLKKYEDEYFEKYYPDYAKLMNDGDELTNAIVLLADTMSVYQYSLNELSLGNQSKDIEDIFENSKYRIECCINKLEKLLSEEK